MSSFTYDWPYIGLGAALVLAALLATDVLRGDRSVSRWRDLVWLARAGRWPIPPTSSRSTASTHQAATTDSVAPSARPWAFLAGPAAALLGRRWPSIALGYFSIPFVNFFAHVGPGVAKHAYNPGQVTAIVLLLPLSLWAFYVALDRYRLGWRAVIATCGGNRAACDSHGIAGRFS